MKRSTLFLVTALVLSLTPFSTSNASEKQLVYGAGHSTKIVELFFNEFEKTPPCTGYTFEVPQKSVKHAGGINASGKYLFGRTGRPLNDKEKDMNKEGIFLGQVPIAIAVGSEVGMTSLTIDQLEKIVTGQYTNWKEVGGPDARIDNTGREGKEALYSILKKKYPFYNAAKFTKTFNKDHEVVGYLSNPHGKYAIAFGAEPNFKDIQGITILTVENFSAGQDLGLVYDQSNRDHPIIKAASEYTECKERTQTVLAQGYYPPNSKK